MPLSASAAGSSSRVAARPVSRVLVGAMLALRSHSQAGPAGGKCAAEAIFHELMSKRCREALATSSSPQCRAGARTVRRREGVKSSGTK
jgi:hypothetical protein